ncbi:hypothetical protein NLJ89_g7931 [Agrocybe chaxingu]|uniref:Uncharacterized protein n=1 Tax=Agrocybe chaxingu TaxID=84603 RepID=A0A9W8K2P9_9AGAR|nr:hypothetical protein NLJ89_g7931 [Agrocybe chaxingu]
MSDRSPPLVIDILDLIVNELGSSTDGYDRVSRSTLTSCALVSKPMSARARGHLFSTISLWCWPVASTAKARRTRIRALKSIMEADPQFVSFVRTLELSLNDDVWGTGVLPGPCLWWSDVEGAGRNAFVNLCLSGCLTELVIHGLTRDPILLLSKIPKGLVSMELSQVSFPHLAPSWTPALEVGDGEGAKLEKLVVDDVSATALFADLGAGSALRTRILAMMQELKTLELGGVHASVGFFQDHIRVVLSHIPLSSFTALRFLAFTMCAMDGTVPDVNTRHIFSAIQESTMPSLEHITFVIKFFSGRSIPRKGTIDEMTDPATGWGWGALDVALGSTARYPSLVMVEIDFRNVTLTVGGPFATKAHAQEEARLRLEAVFPSFPARGGDLKVSFVVVLFYKGET